VRTSNRSRAARAAWAAPVLLLVLSGCSGGGATETATETEPKQSASETEEATTSAAAGELDEDSLVPAMMDAVEDQGTAHVTMTTPPAVRRSPPRATSPSRASSRTSR
jgi:hypothetical protein